MRKSPPSFDFYPDDYIGGTRHLPLIARACYLELLMYQWQNGCIPDDPLERMTLCGLPEESWRTIWNQLKQKFEPIETPDGDTVLVNVRMHLDRQEKIEKWLQNIAKSGKISKVRRDAAKKRWERECKCNANAYANAYAKASKTDANAMQIYANGEGGSKKVEGGRNLEEKELSTIPGDQIAQRWNDAPGVKKIRGGMLSPVRMAALAERWAEPLGDQSWFEGFKEMLATKLPFRSGFEPTIDWALKAGSVEQALEGRFDFRPNSGGGQESRKSIDELLSDEVLNRGRTRLS